MGAHLDAKMHFGDVIISANDSRILVSIDDHDTGERVHYDFSSKTGLEITTRRFR